jgi:hypothetical protein
MPHMQYVYTFQFTSSAQQYRHIQYMFVQVFREPKRSGMVDQVLHEYAASIGRPGSSGAIMFSVVGEFCMSW